MRLIDAEELERLFNEQIEQGVGVIGAFDAFYDALQDTPTVDAVEVVLCRDCKYSCKDGNGRSCEGYWYELSEYYVTVKDDDFCSYGERKDGGEDG